jgi:hypothetical protein
MGPLVAETLLGDKEGTYLKPLGEIKDQMAMPAVMNYTVLDIKNGTERLVRYQKAVENLEQWLENRKKWFEKEVE